MRADLGDSAVGLVVPDRVWRKLAVAADEAAVPIDLGSVLNTGQRNRELTFRILLRGHDGDAPPVPGITGQVSEALAFPGAADLDARPMGVIQIGRCVDRIVTRTEGPRSVYRDIGPAQTFCKEWSIRIVAGGRGHQCTGRQRRGRDSAEQSSAKDQDSEGTRKHRDKHTLWRQRLATI